MIGLPPVLNTAISYLKQGALYAHPTKSRKKFTRSGHGHEIYQNLSFLNISREMFRKKEPSSPFLSAIYMLKSVFSVGYRFDRCVEI